MVNLEPSMTFLAHGFTEWSIAFSPWLNTARGTLLLMGQTVVILCMVAVSMYTVYRVLRRSSVNGREKMIDDRRGAPRDVARVMGFIILLFALPYLGAIALDGLLGLWFLLRTWSYHLFGTRSLGSPMLGSLFVVTLLSSLYAIWRLVRTALSPPSRAPGEVTDDRVSRLSHLFVTVFLFPGITYLAAILCDRLLDLDDSTGASRGFQDGLWFVTVSLLTLILFVQCTAGGLMPVAPSKGMPPSVPKREPTEVTVKNSKVRLTRFLAIVLLLQFGLYLTVIALDGLLDGFLSPSIHAPFIGLGIATLLWIAFVLFPWISRDALLPRVQGRGADTGRRSGVFLFAGLVVGAQFVATRALALTDTFGQADGGFVYPGLFFLLLSVLGTSAGAVALSANMIRNANRVT